MMVYYEMSTGFEGDLSTDEDREALLKMLKKIEDDVRESGVDSRFISYLGKESEEDEWKVEEIKGTRDF